MDDATKQAFKDRIDAKARELSAIMVEVNMTAMKELQETCDCGENHNTLSISTLLEASTLMAKMLLAMMAEAHKENGTLRDAGDIFKD